jgi:hypothetical protein
VRTRACDAVNTSGTRGAFCVAIFILFALGARAQSASPRAPGRAWRDF